MSEERFCVNCKHHQRPMLCVSPAITDVSPVTGRQVAEYCSAMRGRTLFGLGRRCGPKGKHFEVR